MTYAADLSIDRTAIESLNQQFETAYPHEILAWVANTFGDRAAVVTSFQPTGIVTLHMLNEIAPETPVLTLDTGLLFPETYALIDDLEARFNLNLIRVRPSLNVQEQAARYGEALWTVEPDLCCEMRKVDTLRAALRPYQAWITGVRRDQAATRRATPIISWDETHQNVKVSPFASWTEDMIWTYIRAHELPYNTLHDRGYPSIGCQTCTKPADVNDPRAGRWSGHAKTECGIHITR